MKSEENKTNIIYLLQDNQHKKKKTKQYFEGAFEILLPSIISVWLK